MNLINEFFRNYMRVSLNKPMRATLDMPFAAQPVEAIIIPRIDSRAGPIFEFYEPDYASTSVQPPGDQFHRVVVRTHTGHSVEAILTSRLPLLITEGRLVVLQREFQLSEQEIAHARYCVEDFPRFLGLDAMTYVDVHPMVRGIGHVEMRADGWEITLTESTTDDSDFGISHTGTIRRGDDSTYSVNELKSLTDGLTYFFSFVSGVYRTPAVVMASSAEHQRVWGKYGRLNQTQYRRDNWFRTHHGRDLPRMFPGFWECFKSDREKVETIIGQYCESSMIADSGLYKNALVTSRSALEGASKWKLDKVSIRSIEVATALRSAGLTFDNNRLRRITDVRDQVSHADFFTIDDQEYYDLWHLSQCYVEQMLFKRFGYEPEAVREDEATA